MATPGVPSPWAAHRTASWGTACTATTSVPELSIPNRFPEPPSDATLEIGGTHPFEPSIVDFYFAAIERGEKPTVGRFSLPQVLGEPGPAALMRTENSSNPDIRWIHLPFNSMKYTKDLIARVCKDIGFSGVDEILKKNVFSSDKWLDRLHHRAEGDGYHATYLETSCFDINLTDENTRLMHAHHTYFDSEGASMGLFIPFLHWGTEDILAQRNMKLRALEAMRKSNLRASSLQPPYAQGDSNMLDFYTDMMTDQLFDSENPLHLRRTLDQFYYTHTPDTSKRDEDQIVSKHGPDADNKGKRPMQIVDQLWLWILGSNTVITCFDRRWVEENSPQANVYDNVLWQLRHNGQAKCIKSGFELAHLIIEQASSYFFNYSHSLEAKLRFKDIFRKVIGEISDEQIKLFRIMADLSGTDAPMNFTRDQQNCLFDVHEEFNLLYKIRDVIDELTIMKRVVDEQMSQLNPLLALHFHDTFGRHETKQDLAIASEYDLIRHEIRKMNWDEREWFKRTEQYLKAHHKEIEDMMTETLRVYDALRDTISLKQNNASIFEAHASRKESEAVTLFTWVSSIMLPMSFISSVFSINAIELEEGGKIRLKVAMAYIVPISIVISVVFVVITFFRAIREWATDPISSGKAKRNLQGVCASMSSTGASKVARQGSQRKRLHRKSWVEAAPATNGYADPNTV